MFSKKQADAAAEALMHRVRQERDRNSPLLARFPELSRLPADRRATVLDAARAAVWRQWPMILVLVVAVVLSVLWIWAVIGKMELAERAWIAPVLAAIGLHRVNQHLIRRELRRVVGAGKSS